MFRVGLSSFLESISKIRQTNLFWHFLKILKQQQCQLGPCCAALWDGCRLSIPCVLQYAGGVSTCKRHNFHHTSYIENYTQCIVDSQGAACLFSLWNSSLIFRLVYRSASCRCTAFADLWSLRDSIILMGGSLFSGICWICETSET